MTTIAWFHCYAGIAGDMALASLLDAGADLGEVRELVRRLPVRGWEVTAEPVLRAGLGATHLTVHTDPDTTVVRTYAHITGLIEEARLPDRVRDRAQATFALLAEVESRIHRRPVSQIHFHEVGGLDSIVDIVGTCAALEVLGVDEVASSAVAVGIGMIRTEHGHLPNPPPAVVALLATRDIPTYGREVTVELTTPTGAALLAAMANRFGPIPPMRPSAVGYGAGTREIDGLPNTVQVVLGSANPAARAGQPLMVLETNVDDATGEVLGHTIAALLEAGALDAWVTPIVMKKGRPAHTVHVLADSALAQELGRALLHETGSLGIRGYAVERWPASRLIEEVDVEGYAVRVKVGPGRAKAEYEDAARVARRTGLPLREVLARAEATWRRSQDPRHLHPSSPEGLDA